MLSLSPLISQSVDGKVSNNSTPPGSSTVSSSSSSSTPADTGVNNVATTSTSTANPPPTSTATVPNTSPVPSSTHKLGVGAKVGIGVGVSVGTVSILAILALFMRHQRGSLARRAETTDYKIGQFQSGEPIELGEGPAELFVPQVIHEMPANSQPNIIHEAFERLDNRETVSRSQ